MGRIDAHGVVLSTSDSYKEIQEKTEFIWAVSGWGGSAE